jgi:WD40 repeat protein
MSDPGVSEKLKVFISYSRRDASEFADELVAGLEYGGFAPFLDRHDIAAGEDWEARLGGLIAQSDTVVFVVSPESVKSERCVWEVERTLGLSKRLVPVIHKSVPDADIPQQLSRLQFIRFDTGRGVTRPLAELADALRLDLDWIREHTRLGELAARWQTRGKPESLLLRGDDLDAAKAWTARRKAGAPEITEAQRAFLHASDEAESARLSKERAQLEDMRLSQAATARHQRRAGRLLWGVAVLVLGVLGYVTWKSYDVARREMLVFTSLAATALNDELFDRAMRYALQAYPAPGDIPWLTPFSTELEGKLAGAANSTRLYRLGGYSVAGVKTIFNPDSKRVLFAAGNLAAISDLTGGVPVVLKGHTAVLHDARFSRDGHRVVTASADKTARIWDAQSGREVAILEGHSHRVWRAAFSDDGKRVVTASLDKSARVWDAQTGKQLAVLNGHREMVWTAAFNPNGSRVLTTARDSTTRIWDAESGRELVVIEGLEDYFCTASFSPDGTRVVTCPAVKKERVRILNAETGAEIAALKGDTEGLWSVAFSPDGLRVITTPRYSSTARIWNAESGEELVSLRGHAGSIHSAAFSRDGKQVLTASDDLTARIWNADSGEEIAVLKGHTGPVESAAFSPDESLVITASKDGTERIWDLAKGKEPLLLKGHTGPVWSATFSGDGRRIATASGDNTARIWDAESGQEIAVLRGHTSIVRSVALTRGGERAVTASWDQTSRIWDVESGREIAVLKAHTKEVSSAAFSPDGKRVVTASWDQTARIWDVESGQELVVLKGHTGEVESAAFSPDGKRVVTGSWDQTARIWDAQTGKETAVLRDDARSFFMYSAAFSPNGKQVVTASSQGFRTWDADNGQLIASVLTNSKVSSAAFSPNGMRLVTASYDKTARIWDTESGAEIVVLKGHRDGVSGAAFSADGTRVLTASEDATARVWDVTWATLLRGDELRQRVCDEKLVGAAQEFNSAELEDPILRGIDRNDPIARNPCLRRGPLTLDYWTRLASNSWRSLRGLVDSTWVDREGGRGTRLKARRF